MEGTSVQVKRQVRDTIEQGFDQAHQIADTLLFPLAPLDGAIHGVARGVFNWVTDSHPGQSFQSNSSAQSRSAAPAPTAALKGALSGIGPRDIKLSGPTFDNKSNIGTQNNTTGDNNKINAGISGPIKFA